MDSFEQNQVLEYPHMEYLEDQINLLKETLAYALQVDQSEINVSLPTLKNFYFIGNVYKSSWAIYLKGTEKIPKLLYTGNFLIQGGPYCKRSEKSPFGTKSLSSLTSVACTFSYEASFFKQNWALDLNLMGEENDKLKLSVKEYQEFLKLLNEIRAKWLLHLSEEGSSDFVICEFSEPTDPLFLADLEDLDSAATKVKSYFKPISSDAINIFKKLSTNTEFEGKFINLQPGMWLRDDVLIEMEKFYSGNFAEFEKQKNQTDSQDQNFSNPFKPQILKPSY